MSGERRDIDIFRNSDYLETWRFGIADGSPIDLTDCVLSLAIKKTAGDSAVIYYADIEFSNASNGETQILIDGQTLSSLITYGKQESVALAYDLVLTYTDGVKAIMAYGAVNLLPGVNF